MTGLAELKHAARAADDAWQEARERALQHLRCDEALFDCAHCDRVIIMRDVEGHPPRKLWRCSCSPRVSQKVVRGRSSEPLRGEAYAS